MPLRVAIRRYSENIGGALSYAGSVILLMAGDMQTIFAAALFIVAEIVFMYRGHTTAGYSAGAAGLAAGDYLLAFSPSVIDNPALRVALFAMAIVWTLGACRWFVEHGSRPLADRIQIFVGFGCLALRIPGILAAFSGGNLLILSAILLWTTADIFYGRLQYYMATAVSALRRES